MRINKIRIGSKEVMPFTISSGIVTTEVSCLERIAREIPEIGVLTTKSIGPEPRMGNREPILGQYHPGCFVNAVGLTNLGAEEFAKRLSSIDFPDDKFLLASIFGKNSEEFVYVARTLESSVDGFELNLSCPHAKGYGMQLGQDKDIVGEITHEVVKSVRKPVYAKLTPNAGNIGEIAKSAISAGAEGIVAINTVGPGYYSVDGNAVLTNKVGGISGIGITPIGLKCVRDIRQAVGEDIPIIGMGGIRNAANIEAYAEVGATFFGIGSALAGMNEREIKAYFSALRGDLDSNGWTNDAEGLLNDVDMQYRKARIVEKIDSACDFKLLMTDCDLKVHPGQFVFAWIPGVGEKPFSIMDDNPLTLGILERGEFTKQINSLKDGDSFYIRGPYGKKIYTPMEETIVLVGGGCGIVGLYLFAKKFSGTNNITTLLGAKDKNHIPYLDEFEKYSRRMHVITEDGSLGKTGMVSDLFKTSTFYNNSLFFNCGPKAMVEAVLPLELKLSRPEKVYSSVDYMTKCGVGLCGSCANEQGLRTCVEGPFMNP